MMKGTGIIKLIFILGVLSSSLMSLPFTKDLSRGFGDHIEWITLEEARIAASEKGMPIFVLIHAENCPACQSLKPRFAENPDIKTLSEYFQMVNLIGDEEPNTPDFTPDGRRYYPRILFLTPEGEVVPELINTHKSVMDHKFPYYYYTAEQVVEGMINGLNTFYEFEDAEDL